MCSGSQAGGPERQNGAMSELPSREDLLAALLRREHVVGAMVHAQQHLAGIVDAVASSSGTDEALEKVRALLGIDVGQATAVLDMQIRRMSSDGRARMADELQTLRREIEELRTGK